MTSTNDEYDIIQDSEKTISVNFEYDFDEDWKSVEGSKRGIGYFLYWPFYQISRHLFHHKHAIKRVLQVELLHVRNEKIIIFLGYIFRCFLGCRRFCYSKQ